MRDSTIMIGGRKYRPYMLDYAYGGSQFMVEIVAESWEEAEGHLQSIKEHGKITGEIHGTVECTSEEEARLSEQFGIDQKGPFDL